ncbi:MAG: GTPase Era [Fusobacteria bacterium]|nr:GTPase Era [Fusobacteriota bacterium]
MNKQFKSGFIAIIGRPNVGKSTLINNLVGRKIAIMSDKPQTTRNEVIGILTKKDEYQLIFVDTPGIHKPKNNLGEFMMSTVKKSLRNADLIIYMVDSSKSFGRGEEYVIEILKGLKTPVILAINKIDLAPKEEVLPIIKLYEEQIDVANIIPISALKADNIEELKKKILDNIKPGPQYYPEEATSSVEEKDLVSEIIREKILFLTKEEVPHSVAVSVELIEEEGNMVKVYASIFVERKSQKGILIGKQGSMLKKIGKMSRVELEKLWGMKVYLDLLIKVKENWRKRDSDLKNFGFRQEK